MSRSLAHSKRVYNAVMEKGKDAFTEKKNPNIKRILICNYNRGKDLMIFTSDETIDEYKKTDKLSKNSESLDLYLEKQHQGLAMPLLEMKYHKKSKYGSSKLLTINKFTPPPSDERRLFNKTKDKYKFCTVFKESGNLYDKYTFKFEPNPQNSSENFETYLFFNYKLPISDIPKLGNNDERCRWTRTDRVRSMGYTYTLCMLTATQPSMVDNMNTKNMELDPQNEFLTLPPEQHSGIGSPHILADFTYLNLSRASYAIQKTARLDIKIPKERRNLESESIYSVTMDELNMISTSVIFKIFEEKNRTYKQALLNISSMNFATYV